MIGETVYADTKAAGAAKGDTKKSRQITLLQGEKTTIRLNGQIQSVSSDAPKVLSAKKKEGNAFRVAAKQQGSAKVTVKAEGGKKMEVDFHVEEPAVSAKAKEVRSREEFGSARSSILIEVENRNSVYYDSLVVSYKLLDADGKKIREGSTQVMGVFPGEQSYALVEYFGKKQVASVEPSCDQYIRHYFTVCKDVSKHISANVTFSTETDVEITAVNGGKTSATGYVDVLCYRADGEIIGIVSKKFTGVPKKGRKTAAASLPDGTNSIRIHVRFGKFS